MPLAKPGGFRGRRFPHGPALRESACRKSLSQKSEIFASSLSQGSLRAVPAPNFGGESPLTMRTGIFCESLLPLQCPVSLLRWRWICRPKPPLPKGGGFASGKTGGIPRVAGFHMGLCFWKVPAVNPSVTASPCQLPLAREPAGSARGQFRTKLVCIRYFPDPPGIVTEQNGERKQRHCARTDSGGTPPPLMVRGALAHFVNFGRCWICTLILPLWRG